MRETAQLPDAERRALGLVGLARRAGRTAVGTEAVRGAARRGELAGVLLARDAGGNAAARVAVTLRGRGVPLVRCGTRTQLGAAVGRGPVAVVGITDRRLAAEALGSLKRGSGAANGTGTPRGKETCRGGQA